MALLLGCQVAFAQSITPRAGERIFVRGGVAEVAAENRARVDLAAMTPDSLQRFMAAIDSLRGDGVRFDRGEVDSVVMAYLDRSVPTGDTLEADEMEQLIARRRAMRLNSATVRRFMDDRDFVARYIDGGADTLIPKFARIDTLTARERRRLARLDPNAYRHSAIFRDSMPISRVMALSVALPGFSQLYNKQAWKIPVLYGSVAAGVGVYAWQTKEYRPYKQQYNRLISSYEVMKARGGVDFVRYKQTVTDIQSEMIRHNTNRQLAMGFAVASYAWALIDGTLNYDGVATNVKKATTLSQILPGAGQFYNKTYWKVPVVMGVTSLLIYVVNWNNRGYQRFLTGYNYMTDDDENTISEFVAMGYSAPDVLAYKKSYRRSRDLSLIFLGLWYIFQVVDAHATAHMQSYDVSDDLTKLNISIEPTLAPLFTQAKGSVNTYGFTINWRF